MKQTRAPGDHRFFWYALAALPAVFYYAFLFTHAANTPYHDDFYDVFVPLFLYHDSDTLTGAVRGLLWQYHQHFVLYDRLVYWLSSLCSDSVRFDRLILLGNASLVVLFLQLVHRTRPAEAYILPCTSAALFNVYFHENQYWAMGSLQQLTIMVFTMAVLRLLDSGKRVIGACLFSWLAVFTQSNEILVIPLGFLLLLDNLVRQRMSWTDHRLILWTGSSVLCLAVFYSIENVTRVDRFFHQLALYHTDTPLRDIVVNFLSSLAALPFTDNHQPLDALLPGCLQLLAILYLFFRGWRHDRALCLMLLFCTVSLLAASVARTPYYGPTAYVSRYKIFSSTIVCIELLLLVRVMGNKRFLPVLLGLSAASCAGSYYLHAVEIRDYNRYREQKVMEWFYSGKITTFPLANAILDEAYARGLYNPARDLPDYPALPAAIETVSQCPPGDSVAGDQLLQVANEPYSRAVLIGSNDSSHLPDTSAITLWLCGEQSYRVQLSPDVGKHHDPAMRWQELAIIEKKRLTNGTYTIRLQTADQILAIATPLSIATAPAPQSDDCSQHKDTLPAFVPLLYARYCRGP